MAVTGRDNRIVMRWVNVLAAQVVVLVAAALIYRFGERLAWAECLAVIDAVAMVPVAVRASWVALRGGA